MKFKVGDHVVIEKSNIEWSGKFAGKTGVIIEVTNDKTYPYMIKIDGKSCEVWCEVKCLVSPIEKIVITTDGKITTATKYCVDGKKVTATARCAPEDTFDFNVGAKLAMDRLMTKVKPVTFCGFKVGDRVHLGKFNGTIVCIAVSEHGSTFNDLGVEFDDVPNHPGIHNCGGIDLADGATSNTGRCKWCFAKELEHGEYVPKYYNGKVVCVDRHVVDHKSYTIGKIYEFVDGVLTDDTGYHFNTGLMGEPFKSFDEWNKWSNAKWLEIKE